MVDHTTTSPLRRHALLDDFARLTAALSARLLGAKKNRQNIRARSPLSHAPPSSTGHLNARRVDRFGRAQAHQTELLWRPTSASVKMLHERRWGRRVLQGDARERGVTSTARLLPSDLTHQKHYCIYCCVAAESTTTTTYGRRASAITPTYETAQGSPRVVATASQAVGVM